MKTLSIFANHWSLKLYLFFVSSIVSVTANSQAPSLPTVGPAGDVNADTDPGSLVVTVFKWAGGIAIWLAVAWFGLLMFGSVIKAANDARGGDVSWMEAGKSMLGNVLIFILFLTVALWYSAAFLG